MQSLIAEAINMRYSPVAVLWSDEKPDQALQFKEGRWGCIVAMLRAAARGKTAVFDRQTFGCLGGGVGLGFGNMYKHFPGGIEHFLSTGNKEFFQTEAGQQAAQRMPDLEHGEGYLKNPATAQSFINNLPMRDVPNKYVIFKPIELVPEGQLPQSVVFLVNPDQLSALVVLASYDRENNINVLAPFSAGCHSACIIPYQQGEEESPKAIIGLTDITARRHVEKDILSFAVPYKMFQEMEQNVPGSFLEKKTWLHVLERNK